MATLIVPTVARFTVNQTYAGRAVANVLDYSIDTTGSTMSREDAVQAQAEDIITQWCATFLTYQVDALTFDSVSYLDLNSSSGAVGVVTASDDETLPQAGTVTALEMPGNVSALMRKNINGGRGARNGRMYLGGLSENYTADGAPNTLTSGAVTALDALAATFLANTNNTDGLGTAYSSEMVTTHVTARDADGHPITGVGYPVSSLSFDNTLATQRRRLR